MKLNQFVLLYLEKVVLNFKMLWSVLERRRHVMMMISASLVNLISTTSGA